MGRKKSRSRSNSPRKKAKSRSRSLQLQSRSRDRKKSRSRERRKSKSPERRKSRNRSKSHERRRKSRSKSREQRRSKSKNRERKKSRSAARRNRSKSRDRRKSKSRSKSKSHERRRSRSRSRERKRSRSQPRAQNQNHSKGGGRGKGLPAHVIKRSEPFIEDPEIALKVRNSLKVMEDFFNNEQCVDIEANIEKLAVLARQKVFKEKTVDRTPLRSKYFFGYGYTYGSQISKKGGEQILPPGMVDDIPDWIRVQLITPLEQSGLVAEGWINSAVINDYRPGGMIVSHVDPPLLFARPIMITSFFAEGRLVFGSRFSFPNKGGAPECTPPKCACAMPRGSLTIMDGFSADGITHGIRPEDLDGRRVSIVLRHVFPHAPKFGDPDPGPPAPKIVPPRDFSKPSQTLPALQIPEILLPFPKLELPGVFLPTLKAGLPGELTTEVLEPFVADITLPNLPRDLPDLTCPAVQENHDINAEPLKEQIDKSPAGTERHDNNEEPLKKQIEKTEDMSTMTPPKITSTHMPLKIPNLGYDKVPNALKPPLAMPIVAPHMLGEAPQYKEGVFDADGNRQDVNADDELDDYGRRKRKSNLGDSAKEPAGKKKGMSDKQRAALERLHSRTKK